MSDDWIEILAKLPAADQVIQFLSDPRAGGIDLFLGTTRAETSPDGSRLVALNYEAYPEMALARMHKLAVSARLQWPIVKQAILHCVGSVTLGQPSVIIAVSAPHRTEAFAACHWLIDQLKMDVPIWKKEIWADGSGTWVHPNPSPKAG